MEWQNEKVLVVGDSRARAFKDASHPNWKVISQSGATIANIRTQLEANLDKSITILFIISFHVEMTQFQSWGPQAPRVLLPHPWRVDAGLKKVRELVDYLKTEFPTTKVIWTLPCTPDFFRYNRLNNKFAGGHINAAAMTQACFKFYKLGGELVRRWNKQLPGQLFLDLHSVVLQNKCGEIKRALGANQSKGLDMYPCGTTSDGVHLSPSCLPAFKKRAAAILVKASRVSQTSVVVSGDQAVAGPSMVINLSSSTPVEVRLAAKAMHRRLQFAALAEIEKRALEVIRQPHHPAKEQIAQAAAGRVFSEANEMIQSEDESAMSDSDSVPAEPNKVVVERDLMRFEAMEEEALLKGPLMDPTKPME